MSDLFCTNVYTGIIPARIKGYLRATIYRFMTYRIHVVPTCLSKTDDHQLEVFNTYNVMQQDSLCDVRPT